EGQNIRALRAGGWAYLQRNNGRLSVSGRTTEVPEELYDLTHDPKEHQNLAASNPSQLAKMRRLFAQQAPTLPTVPASTLHIAIGKDTRAHLLTGTISASGGTISVAHIDRGQANPIDKGQIRLALKEGGILDLNVEPSDAPIDLKLARDGVAVSAGQL